jgi:hypothetical protein
VTTYTLNEYPEKLAVVRMGPGTQVPSWASSSSLFTVSATATETTIVCGRADVPKKATQEGPFTAFRVEGPLDFALTGVLVSLLTPMAEAEIPVFTISTYDTDWILVPVGKAANAAEEWRRCGHTVAPAVPA